MTIKVGEEIIAGSNQRFRVLAVVPFDDEDESPFVVTVALGVGAVLAPRHSAS